MFSIFESEEKKIVKSHIRQMARLALADGEFHKKERKFIRKIGSRNGLSESEVDAILKNPKSVDFHLPKTKEGKFDQIFDLVNLMSKDGHINDAETEFCQELATRLGFRTVIVGVLVAKIERGLEERLTKKQIKKECQVFIEY